MGNLILMAILAVFSTNLFYFTYCGGGISEVFLAFDASILKSAVTIRNTKAELLSLGKEVDPYFSESLAREYTEVYFADNIVPYMKGPNAGYVVKTYFGDYGLYKGTGRVCEAFPKKYTFTLSATFGGIYTYKKTKTFKIVKGEVV